MKLSLENIKEYYLLHKNKINMYLILIFICILFLLAFYFFSVYDNKIEKDKITYESIEKEKIIEPKTEINSELIFVDIKGSVINEGVYEIEKGKRVIDIINKAGGLKENANTRFINLSKVLIDGDVIVIYSNEEIEEAKKSNIIYVETPCVCEEVKNDACIESNIEKENDLININTSTMEQLMNLSGIGEAKANAIIDYRTNNGGFKTIEDIMNVSGISETIFDKIKNFITV